MVTRNRETSTKTADGRDPITGVIGMREIDKTKETAMSTGYNRVKCETARPELSGSKEVLIYIKNKEGAIGRLLKVERENALTMVKKKVAEDIKELSENMKLFKTEDRRKLYVESAMKNIKNAEVWELIPNNTEDGIVYGEKKIVTIKELIDKEEGM